MLKSTKLKDKYKSKQNCSGRRRTERAQENINLPQERLIKDLGISARKNGLGIIKST